MELKYKSIGNYIHLIDNRNTDLECTKLVGLTVEKKFIPSVANIIGTDLSKYKVIKKNQFACSLMQVSRDGKMPVAMFREDSAIMSPAYPMFEVNDEKELMPEYLEMYLSRSEFDREAVFYAIGGVRGSLEWSDFCDMQLPVPPIEEQRRIVSEYQTVEHRIANNEALIQKLEETAQAIYHHTFVEGIDEENLPEGWRKGCLEDIANFSNGKAIKPSVGSIPIYGGNGIIGFTEDNNAENVIVIGRVGANCGCVYYNEAKCWVNDNSIKGTSRDGHNGYLFFVLKSLELNKVSEGSGQPLLTQTILNGLSFFIPDSKTIIDFNKFATRILRYIDNLAEENFHLRTLLSLLTSKLS
ncbi:restriction endonuclease subunit S [Prevotella pectinovora]|uniref:restriction endonuclease subunit S n=1 Tax=Prevotella pectinovora TaxID=1602169 RepID=UPI0018CE1884|nr:restriction endonuclease subunit S [Prevotella pectinovora]